MMKQLIIIRKDTSNNPVEFANKVSRASMAFLADALCNTEGIWELTYHKMGFREGSENIESRVPEGKTEDHRWGWRLAIIMEEGPYADWLCDSQDKIIFEVENEEDLLNILKKAEKLGLKEGKDFFPLRENYSPIRPLKHAYYEKKAIIDVGFKPLPDEIIEKLLS